MEKPVSLKLSKAKRRSSAASDLGKQCIVHFESTANEEIGNLTDVSFSKIQEVANKRATYSSSNDRLEGICSNIPNALDRERHGIHRRCYQLFTNISRQEKRKSTALEQPHTISKRSRSSDTHQVLFPQICIFCDKKEIKVKGTKQKLIKCVTKCAEDSIKKAVTEKGDEGLLSKIIDKI